MELDFQNFDLFAWINYMQQLTTELMQNNIGVFSQIGLNMYRGLATIFIAWFGIRSALGNRGFDFEKFAGLLLQIAIGFTMIQYYAQPIPGIGLSFTQLIINQTQFLAEQITLTTTHLLFAQIQDTLKQLIASTAVLAGLFNLWKLSIMSMLIFELVALSLAIFVVISFGYVALGILALLGPIFIPFFIVPKLDWLFWGWLKSFMQYAFYPVVANGILYFITAIVTKFFQKFTNLGAWDVAELAMALPGITIVIVAAVISIISIPKIVGNIFSGSSGQGGGGIITAAVAAIKGGI